MLVKKAAVDVVESRLDLYEICRYDMSLGAITPEQAAALIPLLVKIASTPANGTRTRQELSLQPSPSSSCVPSSSSSVSSLSATPVFPEYLVSSDGESSGYSASELFSKKQRNGRSSDAQKYMHVSLSTFLILAKCIGYI